MSDNQTKVGKRPGIGVYVQASAIDGGRSNLKDWEIEAYQTAKKALFTAKSHFIYDFIHIIKDKDIKVRFMKMSSLFDAHPCVEESMAVRISDDKPMGVLSLPSECKISGQIYHRMETMVDPTHPSWIFHSEVTKWEEFIGLFAANAPQSSFGSPKAWKTWVETKIPYDQYESKLRLLFGQFVGNELTRQSENPSVDLKITRVCGVDGDMIHVELLDGMTHKEGIRASFTCDQFARALTGEVGITGKIVRWNLKNEKETAKT